MDTKIIPIFPLDLVLFPRQALPLRIFEPRYKQMVDDCMLGDGLFGVCLIDSKTIMGWNAPKEIGTITKITECKDIDLDGLQIHIETIGRNKFKILELIPPAFEMPENYDPYSPEGHQKITELYEKSGTDKKMYLQAKVELIPEIDGDIPLQKWKTLVDLWKDKIIYQAQPQVVDKHSLDHVLEKYYLKTDVPTVDYVYSLAALGAKDPNDLQPVLEAENIDELLERVEQLMTVK